MVKLEAPRNEKEPTRGENASFPFGQLEVYCVLARRNNPETSALVLPARSRGAAVAMWAHRVVVRVVHHRAVQVQERLLLGQRAPRLRASRREGQPIRPHAQSHHELRWWGQRWRRRH